MTPEIITAINDAAYKHDLNRALLAAVVEQESGGNPWAMRYEDRYRWLWPSEDGVSAPQGVSHLTEVVQQKTSWGLMQVMGAVARERGCKLLFLSALCEPKVGLEYGCLHLNWIKRHKAVSDNRSMLAAYNAGNPLSLSGLTYADSVLRRMATWEANDGFI